MPANDPRLTRLTERIWYLPFEEERDRPNLCYIKGDHWSLAVDAGHSVLHLRAFYSALEANGLPLPALTVITHWHWDHSFALADIHGLSLANDRTNAYLRAAADTLAQQGPEAFCALSPAVRAEYAPGQPMRVVPADMAFTGEINLDAGGCPIRVFQAPAPHTDDSTLIFAPTEGVLFLGDAPCREFATGRRDPALCRALSHAIRDTGASLCLEGHWTPQTAEEAAAELVGPEQP